MATEKRRTFAKLMTPLGTAVYPKLNAPDTKFKAAGEYQCKLRLNEEESGALIETIEAELKKYWPEARAELEQKLADAKGGPAKAKAKLALEGMKEADKPYKPAYDEEGNETGEYEFNFKCPASWIKDKDKPTEKVMPMRPKIFDAQGKELKVAPPIWGGSRLHVAAEMRPFSMPIGVGISLRLQAVQIIELQQGGAGQTAEGYGFGKQEGYEADPETEAEAAGFPAPAQDGGSDEF